MKPILFSTPMVQAILNRLKWQTRRVVKPQPDSRGPRTANVLFEDWHGKEIRPKYKAGDILWVRETWQHTKVLNLHPVDANYGYVYRADAQPWEDIEGWKWKSPIFMPKEACRIFLKVTDVRVERLQSISEADAKAEGVDSVDSFFALWQKINGTESLAANPWVWVYEFESIPKPRALEQPDVATLKAGASTLPAPCLGSSAKSTMRT